MKSVIDIDVLGSYNTVKATLPYLKESAAKHRTDGTTQPANGTGGRIIFVSATLHYQGTPLQSHVSVAKSDSRSKAAKTIPIGRWGTVKEIADATVYLFSDAGNFVNGETLVVDGGAWHTAGVVGGFEYPDFLLSGEAVTGVAGGKKSKL